MLAYITLQITAMEGTRYPR